jgi:UDP-N-acetylglucosamine:LPS N-acetylglucosamine transferase
LSEKAKYNKETAKSPVVLVAPLDWGLGHATRCIPIIYELLNAGFEVFIAAEGTQKELLAREFPLISILPLKGYRISFGNKKWKTPLKILFQVPKILTAINKEKQWLKELLKQKHLDIIISDNRFGLYHPSVYSVFLTHQLYIKTPFGALSNYLLQKINYRFINKFSGCWIPDTATNNNLGGILSHPAKMPLIPIQYIGIVSRIKKRELPVTNKLLVLISGPEPQRSIFESKVLQQLRDWKGQCILIAGQPAAAIEVKQIGGITVYNHLPSGEMESMINQADIIISRPGYSTVMDILPLGKKCIFIPTPGQTEQEYLAGYLAANNWCVTDEQARFSLARLVEKVNNLPVSNKWFKKNDESLKAAITNLADRFH